MVEEKPVSPKIRLICPAAMLGKIMGMKKGVILIPPFSNRVWYPASASGKPPIPLPIITPSMSVFSRLISSLASSIAILAEATANWLNRAILRASLKSM